MKSIRAPMKKSHRIRISSRAFFRGATVMAALSCVAIHAAINPLPEKIACAVPDQQDRQVPDRVELKGWIGTRIEVNENNRLVKLDPARLLQGYRHRPGPQAWDGEHVGKWLHAATLAWVNTGDAELRKKLDYVASELMKCQLEDGYLGTYAPEDRWTQWDVWAHKYNLIGLVTYMRYTGNMEPMPACRKMADLLCNTFGDEGGKRDIIPVGTHKGMASTSVLEPIMLLYRLTGETRYLDFAKYILRSWEQKNGPKIISTLLRDKRVDGVGDAKAYEMLSCLNGALEYYRTTGDKEILQACQYAWQDIVDHRLYITGTSSYREFFHGDDDLPNVNNVGETCVTVTWLQFNAQLLRLTGQARYAEQLERTVLNQLFGAQSCDGTAWGYYVQMQGKKPYSSDLNGHCCLSSGPRGVALIPTFAVTTDAAGVVVNLYESGEAKLNLRDGTAVTLKTQTEFPGDDHARFTISDAGKHQFALKLRMPTWSSRTAVRVNGKAAEPVMGADGYASIEREWKKGDKVDVQFTLEAHVVAGSHLNQNRVAVMYGPLVLAADESLLGGTGRTLDKITLPGSDLASLHLKAQPAPAAFKTWHHAQAFRIDALYHDSVDFSDAGKPVQIQLVPFADAGSTGSSYKIWLPFAAPPAGRSLLVDGVEIRSRKPNAGSIIDGDFTTFGATFSNKASDVDWFGVFVEHPETFSRVVFAHGKAFHNGGWFDASEGKPRLQIQEKAGEQWKTVAEFKDYPATTAKDSAGLKDGQEFVCELPKPLGFVGIRVIGKPSTGDNPRQNFSTCAELEAFSPGK